MSTDTNTPSTPADKDADTALRERLNTAIRHRGFLVGTVLDWCKDELSRAGGERDVRLESAMRRAITLLDLKPNSDMEARVSHVLKVALDGESAGGERATTHPCPVCEQPCDCRFPGEGGEDCECKERDELRDEAEIDEVTKKLGVVSERHQETAMAYAGATTEVRDLHARLEAAERERDEARRQLAAIEAARANECQPNVLDSLPREQRERFRHLEGTPDETKLCYLYRGMVRVMGSPKEGDGHNCDEMGCGSCGDHVLMRFMAPSRPYELAELRRELARFAEVSKKHTETIAAQFSELEQLRAARAGDAAELEEIERRVRHADTLAPHQLGMKTACESQVKETVAWLDRKRGAR